MQLKSAVELHKKNQKNDVIDYSFGKSIGLVQAYNTVLLWIEDLRKEFVLEEKK